MTELTLHSSRLLEAIGCVKHAIALSPQRPVLTTLLLEGDEKGVRLVAADNYRIAIADLSEEASDFGQALVWSHDLPLVVSVVRSSKGTVAVRKDAEGHLTVEAGALSLTVRLCDGTFPNYRRADVPWEPGDRVAWGVNPAFLRDTTAALAKASGHIRIYPDPDPEKPILVTGPNYREVIMPVRLASVTERAA